jgi:cytochrome P450
MPWIDFLLLKNPIRLWLSRLQVIGGDTPVVKFAKSRMTNRLDTTKTKEEASRQDFLSRFLAAKESDPTFFDDAKVLSMTVSNMNAGSDTTAITLRAAFYYLLKYPATYKKLLHELESIEESATSYGIFPWSKVRNLPYLSAVVKEVLRIHPAVGLSLERVVPTEGTQICGKTIPSGTIVGASPWVLHFKEEIFGDHPHEFRPARWIDCSDQQKAMMNNCLLSFGMGARTCLGKNISLLEIHKLLPAMLMHFEVCGPILRSLSC